MQISCPISLGELMDKISILRIKQEKISDPEKLKFISQENELLTKILNDLQIKNSDQYIKELMAINIKLWEAEDQIRLKEHNKEFDHEFIELARSVYINNDARFKIKHKINKLHNSNLQEMKSYSKYTPTN